jgi:D-3-phosphoglycerate dehydrogenase
VARKLVEYSDAGSTIGAVNFPAAQLPARPHGARFMHVHHNEPGMLAALIDTFTRRGINISGQFLQTDGEIGYVVIEVDGVPEDTGALLQELRGLKGTIRARVLYVRQ